MKRLLPFTLLVLCTLCAGAYNFFPKNTITWGSFAVIVPEKPKEAEMHVPVQKNKVTFVGDVMLARSVEKLLDIYGEDYPFSQLPAKDADSYLVGNFEASVPVEHVHTPDLAFSFSVEERYLAGLSRYGFTHLGLANNHSYDFGGADFEHTVEALDHASTTAFGNPRNLASSSVPLLKVGSSTVALIALYAVDTVPTQEQIQALLSQASKVSTYQVVFVHWGTEYKLMHDKTQEKLAHSLIDAGADVIIGHHPHVVEDIEEYNNGIVFYSLGNFVFDQFFSDDVQKGLTVELSELKGGIALKLIPVSSIGSRSAPRQMAQFEKDDFLAQLALRSDAKLKNMISEGQIEIGSQH